MAFVNQELLYFVEIYIQKPCIPWSPQKSYTYGGQFLKLKKKPNNLD